MAKKAKATPTVPQITVDTAVESGRTISVTLELSATVEYTIAGHTYMCDMTSVPKDVMKTIIIDRIGNKGRDKWAGQGADFDRQKAWDYAMNRIYSGEWAGVRGKRAEAGANMTLEQWLLTAAKVAARKDVGKDGKQVKSKSRGTFLLLPSDEDGITAYAQSFLRNATFVEVHTKRWEAAQAAKALTAATDDLIEID